MTPRNWATLLALSVLWGGSFLFNALALEGFSVLAVVALRVALAALALWGVILFTGAAMPRGWPVWRALALMSLLNNIIPFTLIVYGQTMLASGLAAILNATTPIFTALIAHRLTGDEKLSPRKLAGILLGFFGVVVLLMARQGGALLAEAAPLGIAAALGAALSYGFAGVHGRSFARMGVTPLATATGQVTVSALLLLPVAMLVRPEDFTTLPALVPALAVIGLGLLSTAVAYLLFFRILASAGATNISLVTLLVPPSAILLGIVFLGESLPAPAYAGLALIALGLAVLDGRLLRRKSRSSA
ncbi:MAG: DMT family transporter [Hyphomicrobiaceae bacterium]|nr:DMT family transporter [Hyphomicrobiaceae bacterium]